MIRLFIAVMVVAGVTAATLYFAQAPGTISIDWQGWRIDTSVGVALVLLLVALIVLAGLWRLLRSVFGAPRRYLKYRREGLRLRGFRDLTRGLVAIAAGDGREAERHRARAEAALNKGKHEQPPLALLLSAQAALLRGDGNTAKQAFTSMLDDPETAFLGYRGLIINATKAGDDRSALQLAEKARRLRPGSSWILQYQLGLEARLGDWRRATDTLRDAVKRGAITAETGRRYKLVLLLARSIHAQAEQRNRDALTYAAQAHGLDTGFAPAAVHYAGLLRDGKHISKGLRVLESAWSRRTHPEIAAAYDTLLAAEAPVSRARRFERLVDLRPNDPEAHLAGAAMAMSAQLWGEARRHLDRAGGQGPGPWSQRLCQSMAALEKAEGHNAATERLWLERANRAARDPAWVCRDCHVESPNWGPLCPSCQSFASLHWEIPASNVAPDRPPIDAVILPPEALGHDRIAVPPQANPPAY